MNPTISRTLARSVLPALALVAAAGATPGAAQNLLPNHGFDSNIAGWSPHGFDPATLEWSPLSVDGRSGSGSLRLTNTAAPADRAAFSAGPCVAVEGGAMYAATGQFLLPGGQSRIGAVYLMLQFFSDASCTTSAGHGTTFTVIGTAGSWRSGFGDNRAPDSARSARLLAVLAKFDAGGSIAANIDNVVFGRAGGIPECLSTERALCLRDGRFRVTASWKTHDGTAGLANAVPLTSETGYFWFFNVANVEVVLKVIDACVAPYDRYWVFASGLTNVFARLEVTDTVTGARRVYENPQGRSFQPILDTSAFATCP